MMDRGVFLLLLLSGLFWSGSALFRYYHYINERMSWPEAQSYCREKYTDLATVDTVDDVNRMVNKVDAGYSGSVWIGLKRGTQKRWAWSNGANKSSLYSNWAPGEPDENACVAIFNGSWLDMGCSYLRYFVCYKENNGYVMVKTAKTWRDAQSYCRQYHTDLPTIHNSEENQQITRSVVSGSYFWIGLFPDSWEWSDEWSLFFRNWAAGQPSLTSGSGDCVGMSRTNSGKWVHESCDLKYPFICYGEERKKQIVRLTFSCNGECTLNDPTAILNEVRICFSWVQQHNFPSMFWVKQLKDEHIKISEKLKILGLESDSEITWRKEEGEEVFHQESIHGGEL